MNKYVVFHEAVPGLYPYRSAYRIFQGTDELQSVVELDINIFLLVGLIFLVLLQMIIPWRPQPIYDLGGNLPVNAAIVLLWSQYLVSIVVSIPI